jgi:hypothetical protein
MKLHLSSKLMFAPAIKAQHYPASARLPYPTALFSGSNSVEDRQRSGLVIRDEKELEPSSH